MAPTILQEIFEAKKLRIAERRKNADIEALKANAREKRAGLGAHRLRNAVSDQGINIIAEFKRASPSNGIINDTVDAAATAQSYERAGARAISVLTEEDYFKGSIGDLNAVRAAVGLPILQKDFIFDEFQIYEAAAAGADAILLIVAMLDDETLLHLHRVAGELCMDALVEVHDESEMARAAVLGARLIGVNNRNLKTFAVSLDISYDLIRCAPAGAVMVAESGLKDRRDIMGLKRSGFGGFLIGETLMRSEGPEQTLKELTRLTRVKICGITNFEDAHFAAKAGADALGFNFYERSSRYIPVETAAEIVKRLPGDVLKIGVFVNEDVENILRTLSLVALDAVQLHGDEPPGYVDAIKKKTSRQIIKAFRISNDFKPENVLDYDLDTILLDAYSAAGYGGTGETFDWAIAREVRELVPQMYLAGGLSVDNIADAVRLVGPYGVDACSCLEQVPGIKNHIKVDTFIDLVKGV